jgi:hypothetical protein
MPACEIRVPIRHVTRVQQVATLRYYRRLPPSSRDPPIWTVLKSGLLAALSAHNWSVCAGLPRRSAPVVGAVTTRE